MHCQATVSLHGLTAPSYTLASGALRRMVNRDWAEVSQSLRGIKGHTHMSKYTGGTSGREESQPFMVLLDTGTQVILPVLWEMEYSDVTDGAKIAVEKLM